MLFILFILWLQALVVMWNECFLRLGSCLGGITPAKLQAKVAPE